MQQGDRISRRLKLRQLEVLLAVAQSGSMAKAAEQLAITQPVISKSIADLENTLGVQLFDRTSQGVETTAHGRALIRRSTAIFNDLRMSVAELEALSDPSVGELRIGSSETLAAGLLSTIIDRLSQRYPRLTFEITLGGDTAEAPHHRELRDRSIDLIIGRFPGVIPEDMEATHLYDERLLIAAGRQNPLTRRRRVDLAELLDHPWCGHSFDIFPWSLIGDEFRARKLNTPLNVVKVNSVLARNSLLASGRFLTVLNRTLLHFGPGALLKRVPVDLSVKGFPVGITTSLHRSLAPAAQLFINSAREVVKPVLKGE